MRKITGIFFLSIYIFSVPSFSEIFKIRLLIQHYQETKADVSSISFAEFLTMHYLTDDGNKNDNKQDNKLPFKSDNETVINYSNYYTAANSETAKLNVIQVCIQENKFFFMQLFHSNYTSNIWQPPKC